MIYSTGGDAEILIIIDLQNVKMVNTIKFLSNTTFRSRLNFYFSKNELTKLTGERNEKIHLQSRVD
jgi:hypothetical protein